MAIYYVTTPVEYSGVTLSVGTAVDLGTNIPEELKNCLFPGNIAKNTIKTNDSSVIDKVKEIPLPNKSKRGSK